MSIGEETGRDQSAPDYFGKSVEEEENGQNELTQEVPDNDDDQPVEIMPFEIATDANNEAKGKTKLKPMTPLAASATVVNLLLATGPYTYPYGYCALGPLISAPLLFITGTLSWISATYLVEALSVANTIQKDKRRDSLFTEESYKTPE